MFPKRALLIVAALLLVLRTDAVMALGLGAMRTKSALNQPFYAEIELNGVGTDEIDAVKARLASREDFAKAGAERPGFLTRLKFLLAIGTDGRAYIQVSSREAIREPYIDFLVEVLWPEGRLVKEYTVLLDPPALGPAALPPLDAPQTSAGRRQPPPEPAPPLRGSESPEQPPQRGESAPPPLATPVPPQARGTRFPLFYGPVPRGAMLTPIAREMTPPGATVEQTAMALFRNNRDAFSGGNINRLRAGTDLVVPTADELFALDPAAARRQFQEALAGRSVDITPLTDIASDVRLRIAGDGETPSTGPLPASELEPAEPSGLRGDVLMLQETTESNRQEAIELRNRMSELEAQINDIRRLVQLRNDQSAPLQQVPGAGVESVGDALPVPPAPGSPETGLPAKGLSLEPPISPAEGIVQTATADGRAERRPQDGAGEQPLVVGARGAGGGVERSMPRWVLAGAAVAVALGGLGLLSYRRRRARIADVEVVGTNAAPAQGLLSSDSPPAAASPPDSDLAIGVGSGTRPSEREPQEADVIAEADIYILYGRYREAEALLREEVEREPDRYDLKYKLGEALLGSGNREALTELLEAMRRAGDREKDAVKWASLEAGLAGLGMGDNDAPSAAAPRNENRGDAPGGAGLSDRPEELSGFEPIESPLTPRSPMPSSPSASSPWPLALDAEQPAGDRLDLDFDGLDAFAPPGPESEPADGKPVEVSMPDDVLSPRQRMKSELQDEPETKLDLARAFVEMEDPAAARALLEEVVQDGSDEQRADAAAILAKLG